MGLIRGRLDADVVVIRRPAITLHNPLDFTDPQSLSTTRCLTAARAILTQHYTLIATSFDITRLHPFATYHALHPGEINFIPQCVADVIRCFIVCVVGGVDMLISRRCGADSTV